MPGKMAAEWVCVVSFAKKDGYLNFELWDVSFWNEIVGREDMILDIRCFFVDMVVKQSETCFWCMIMSPCYPSIQQNLDKDHYYLIHTWNSRYWCFDHPSLFFIGHIGHLFISTPNDFSPPKHVVKITFHAASGGEGWEEQAENWQGKNAETRAKSSIIKYHPFLGKLYKLHANVAGKCFVDFPKIIVDWLGLVL